MEDNQFIENYKETSREKLLESKEIKQKGKFNYLSWSLALKNLKIAYPEASYKDVKYPDMSDHLVLPYLKTETGFYVSTEIFLTREDRINNIGYEYTFPVLNHVNKAHEKPTAFEINTSLQRCLAKNIAVVTGVGLSLFTNEDIPDDEPDINLPEQAKTIKWLSQSKELKILADRIAQTIKNYPDIKDIDWFIQACSDVEKNLPKPGTPIADEALQALGAGKN